MQQENTEVCHTLLPAKEGKIAHTCTVHSFTIIPAHNHYSSLRPAANCNQNIDVLHDQHEHAEWAGVQRKDRICRPGLMNSPNSHNEWIYCTARKQINSSTTGASAWLAARDGRSLLSYAFVCSAMHHNYTHAPEILLKLSSPNECFVGSSYVQEMLGSSRAVQSWKILVHGCFVDFLGCSHHHSIFHSQISGDRCIRLATIDVISLPPSPSPAFFQSSQLCHDVFWS